MQSQCYVRRDGPEHVLALERESQLASEKAP